MFKPIAIPSRFRSSCAKDCRQCDVRHKTAVKDTNILPITVIHLTDYAKIRNLCINLTTQVFVRTFETIEMKHIFRYSFMIVLLSVCSIIVTAQEKRPVIGISAAKASSVGINYVKSVRKETNSTWRLYARPFPMECLYWLYVDGYR